MKGRKIPLEMAYLGGNSPLPKEGGTLSIGDTAYSRSDARADCSSDRSRGDHVARIVRRMARSGSSSESGKRPRRSA